jgi:4a-hydroxytetrahydrobiopterin dehydratase
MPPSDSFVQMVTETRVSTLARRPCKPCEGDVEPMSPEAARELLASLPGWELEGSRISRTYRFRNYFETMAFVNASAWISHSTDHHPDLEVSYNTCRVVYWTHSVNGLSENDFICAAKLDALVAL